MQSKSKIKQRLKRKNNKKLSKNLERNDLIIELTKKYKKV